MILDIALLSWKVPLLAPVWGFFVIVLKGPVRVFVMAGDWIKFEIGTSDKAEVWAIAQDLSIDPDAVVGKLLRVWAWFDQHTEDGNAPSVTKMLLDRNVGVTGFCNSLISVGWMAESEAEVFLPHFDRHNGKTAKTRATTAKRVASFKNKTQEKQKGNDNTNDKVTPTPLPKEEKRREDISNTNVLDSSCSELSSSKPKAPLDDSQIFISIPTNKFNTESEERPITENKISEWQAVYPAVDVRQSLMRIRSWVINNPSKRKTFGGINKFIDTWLAKDQNSGGSNAANQQHRSVSPSQYKPGPADLVRAQARQALESLDREAGNPRVHPTS